MKSLLKLTLITTLASLSLSAMAKTEWLTSWDKAAKLSKESGKPILADFTGSDWCSWCILLKKEVFDTPEFASWAKKNVILLELDFPNSKKQPESVKKQNEKLAAKYKIEGYPTVLFLDADGKKLADYGYDEGGSKNWIKKANELIAKAKK